MKKEENQIQADYLFDDQQDERLSFFDSQDLIELKPFGLSLNNDLTRPFLILKDAQQNLTLPVAVSQIEAGVTLTQSNPHVLASTPHAFLEKLISSLDIKIEKCVFVEIKGHHQFVRIFMVGHPKYQSLKLRADEAMSLCIHLKVPLFATRDYINKSKVLSTQSLNESAQILLQQRGLAGKLELFH